MKILIVGGTSALSQALKPVLSEFAEVITAGRLGCDVHLDLRDPVEMIEFPKDIDVVINTAAHFGGDDYEQMYQAEIVNVLGALTICHACIQSKVRHLVQISSTSAYLDATSEYYGIYALSKKHADNVTQFFCSSFKLPCTIIRPSQLYGNGDAFRKHRPFLYTAIDKAEKNENISIFGTNDALRNYIHIDDFTEIISRVVKKRIAGLYSCTNVFDVSLSEVANAVIDAFHSKSDVIFLKELEDVQDNVFPYDDSLYKTIKYYPQLSIADGVKRIAAYRLRNATITNSASFHVK